MPFLLAAPAIYFSNLSGLPSRFVVTSAFVLGTLAALLFFPIGSLQQSWGAEYLLAEKPASESVKEDKGSIKEGLSEKLPPPEPYHPLRDALQSKLR